MPKYIGPHLRSHGKKKSVKEDYVNLVGESTNKFTHQIKMDLPRKKNSSTRTKSQIYFFSSKEKKFEVPSLTLTLSFRLHIYPSREGGTTHPPLFLTHLIPRQGSRSSPLSIVETQACIYFLRLFPSSLA
jgi:hypothetical protein